MKTIARGRLVVGVLVITGLAAATSAEDGVTLTKEVDHTFASASEILTYTITVANDGDPLMYVGLFSDDFPDEVTGCTWTCTGTGNGGCENASGAGDIEQLVSVSTDSSATIVATCTFSPSPGHECAVNQAEFFTMDPDRLRQATATTCDWNIILFFATFDSGNTSSWSVTFP